jgi:hypothetical protein
MNDITSLAERREKKLADMDPKAGWQWIAAGSGMTALSGLFHAAQNAVTDHHQSFTALDAITGGFTTLWGAGTVLFVGVRGYDRARQLCGAACRAWRRVSAPANSDNVVNIADRRPSPPNSPSGPKAVNN